MSDFHHHDRHHHNGGAGHPGFDPVRLAEMEEHRRRILPPEEILPDIVTSGDLTLLDMGCGVGFFSIPAAKLLSRGKVYAVDLQEGMVDATMRRARESGISNIEGIAAPAADVPLPAASADVVLMSMVLHDIDEKAETLREIDRLLKPQGTLFIIEMDRGTSELGPPQEIRITPDALTDMLVAAGFSVRSVERSSREKDFYFTRAQAPARV